MFDVNQPPFPENTLGLQRGSILRANIDISYLGVRIGDEFPLGFDGEYVRCGGATWDIGQLEGEIYRGIWTVTDKIHDLSKLSPDEVLIFAILIEQRRGLMD